MTLSRPLVLVVEDCAPTRELLSDFLELEGYRVESVASGTSGLARMQAGGIDAVLLDLHLPDMDGWSLCRQFRAGVMRPEMPIIVMSAEADHGQRAAACALGASDYLEKPFDMDALLAAIVQCCTKS